MISNTSVSSEKQVDPEIKLPPLVPRGKYSTYYETSLPDSIVDLTQAIWDKYGPQHLNRNPFCKGRDHELDMLEAYLGSSKAPPNVLLTGPAGCGKSALMSELARRILVGAVQPYLKMRRIFVVEAGNCTPDVFKKLSTCTKGHAIIVIDECHQVFENFSFNPLNLLAQRSVFTSGGDNLKSGLAEAALPVIGITDRPKELNEDAAWIRRFHRLRLEELSYATSVEILKDASLEKQISKKCEKQVTFEKGVLELAVILSMAFLKDEMLPAKVFRVLEPAAYRLCGKNFRQQKVVITTTDLKQYIIERFHKSEQEVEQEIEAIEASLHGTIPPHEPLARYTINLSLLAKRGKLEPAYQREELLKNIAAVMASDEANNVLLLGKSGAGKTRIIEGFVLEVFKGTYKALHGKDILLLKVTDIRDKESFSRFLESARRYRGKFILVIDEVHRLAHKSSVSSPEQLMASMSFNPLQDFKEAWGRGEIPSILLTTPDEATSILDDTALMRRMTPFDVLPFTIKQTHLLLQTVSSNFEKKTFKECPAKNRDNCDKSGSLFIVCLFTQ